MTRNVLATAYKETASFRPRADVRERLDEAARRGWIEIGRRTARVSLLAIADTAGLTVAALLTILTMPGVGDATAEVWAFYKMTLFIQPLAIGVAGAYAAGHNRVSFGRISIAVACATVLALLEGALLGTPATARISWGEAAFFATWTVAVIFFVRLFIDFLIRSAYRVGLGQQRVLVIGSEAETARMKRMLRDQGAVELRVVGRLSPTHRREAGALDVVSDLESAVRAYDAWGVIVASTTLSFEALETIFHRCFELGVAVSVMPKTLHRFGPRLELRKTRAGALLRLRPRELGIPQLTIKRAMDLSLSLVLLLVLWPVFLVLAIAIRLDSRGPIFFKQTRAGLGGQPFGMYKFRTMVDKADQIKAQLQHLNESGDPRLFKIRNDPRVTRVGSFLRKISLDELPQLFNVIRGDMSLIGPRPFFPEDMDEYADHHMERLSVLPGITGWWQVRGRSAVLDFEEVVRLDREYIDQWSVWFDLKILLLTLPAVLRRTGAY